MPNRHYPAFLDVSGKDCLVVGGGPVALMKARGLARAGARVTAVAPEFVPGFRRAGAARLVRRAFCAGDLAGRPWLVACATDDEALNRRVGGLCARRRIWANVADRPALCGFILPAVARRGSLTLAVSTGGASPALAGFLRDRLKTALGPRAAALARRLKRMRPRLLRMPLARRKTWLRGVFDREFVSGGVKPGAKNRKR